ncbi:MAG: serine hydrolase [Pseudomonadota bacterium]
MKADISHIASNTPTYIAAALPTAEQLSEQRYRNSIALHTQLLCSGVFVSNRKPEAVIAEDLYFKDYHFHDWATTKWKINPKAKAVTLWAPATKEFKATPKVTSVYTPGFGCTLLPDGAQRTAFAPPQILPVKNAPKQRHFPVKQSNPEIEAALDLAFDDSKWDTPNNTRAMVIVHKGQIIGERYAKGFAADQRLIGWSMGKSVAALLFGVFVHETGYNIDDPVPIAEWAGRGDPRGAITARHLLNMAGGLKFHNPGPKDSSYYSELHDHESVYFRGQNTEALSIKQPLQYTPGTVFQYRNANTLTLMSLLKRYAHQTDQSHLSWPRTALFDKIGSSSFVLEPDAYGNFVITGYDYATALDWAKLGQLLLQDGVWEGKRLLPKGWGAFMAKPSPASSRYGGQVWLNSELDLPNVPKDAFWFLGWLGQYVLIIPSRDLVVVRLGHSSEGGTRAYMNQVVSKAIHALKD